MHVLQHNIKYSENEHNDNISSFKVRNPGDCNTWKILHLWPQQWCVCVSGMNWHNQKGYTARCGCFLVLHNKLSQT